MKVISVISLLIHVTLVTLAFAWGYGLDSSTGQIVFYVLTIPYFLHLFWYLFKTKPYMDDFVDVEPEFLTKGGFRGNVFRVIGIVLLLAVFGLIFTFQLMLHLFLLAASIYLLSKNWRDLRNYHFLFAIFVFVRLVAIEYLV